MAKGWKQIYPRDVYRRLLIISGETGVSFPKLVNITVREGLIYSPDLPDKWKLPKSTSEAHLLVERPIIEPKPLTKEQIEQQNKIQQEQKLFSEIIKQWATMRQSAKKKHIEAAKKWADKVPNAKLVLALANGKTPSLKVAERGEAPR